MNARVRHVNLWEQMWEFCVIKEIKPINSIPYELVALPLAPPILTFLIKGVVYFILIVVLSLFVISQSANAKKTEKK